MLHKVLKDYIRSSKRKLEAKVLEKKLFKSRVQIILYDGEFSGTDLILNVLSLPPKIIETS